MITITFQVNSNYFNIILTTIISGEFRGALCNFCNLNKKKLLFIPVYVNIKFSFLLYFEKLSTITLGLYYLTFSGIQLIYLT